MIFLNKHGIFGGKTPGNTVKVLLLLGILLSACNNAAPQQPTLDSTAVFQSALLTATYAVQAPTALPLPTATPAPTALPTPTPYSGPPPTLPAVFTTSILSSSLVPQTYIQDTCQYLKQRWDPNNAAPGTVLMPIMYHSITEDFSQLVEDSQIHHSDLKDTLTHAQELGFETVTTQQVVNFLEHNAKIPKRSLLLIVDDRRPGVVREHFWEYLKEYKWTLTLAWLIGDTDSKPASYLKSVPDENYTSLWQQMEAYNASGMLDVQAHGYIHNVNATEASTDEFLTHEMIDSRKVLQEHFYCKDYKTGLAIPDCKTDQPLAYIWPGGSFTRRAAEFARQAGFHLGFTVNPRGPVMFNWVPLAAATDPASPSWLPEIPAGDPLMTLPRYWSTDAAYRLDEVANISDEAAAYAKQHRAEELLYYDVNCKATTGEIPAKNK